MRLEITQSDIVDAKSLIHAGCPVGVRLIKQGFRKVSVGTDKVSFDGKLFRLSPGARRFIKEFDNNQVIQPTTITIYDYR